jgi:hypothetical protein
MVPFLLFGTKGLKTMDSAQRSGRSKAARKWQRLLFGLLRRYDAPVA